MNKTLKIYLSTLLLSSIIWSQPFSGGPRITTVFLILLGIFVFTKNMISFNDQRITRFSQIIACFWIPAILSLIGSFDLESSLKMIILLPLFIPFAGGIIYLKDNYADNKLLINIVTVVCVLWVTDGLIQFTFGQDIFGILPRDGERIVGPFAHHLRLSLFLSITLPLILPRLEKYGWGLLISYLAMAALVIMLSGVRTDLLTALIAIGIYVVTKKRAKLLLLFLPLLLVMGLLASSYSNIAQHKLNSFSGVPDNYKEWNNMSSHRLEIWLTAWNMYLDNPFKGVGAKSFSYAYDEYKGADSLFDSDTISHAHHPIISIAAETGTIGLVGLFMALWLLLYKWGGKSRMENTLENPWLQMLILIFFPIQSMPLLFTLWWFPVVSMVILFYLSDIDLQHKSVGSSV